MRNALLVPPLLLTGLSFLFLSSMSNVQQAQAEQPAITPDAVSVTDQPVLLPMSLGKRAGCFDSTPRLLNNGAYPEDLVVAGGGECEDHHYTPQTWRNGSWTRIELPEGVLNGTANSVSDHPADEPTVTGTLTQAAGIPGAWVKSTGQPMSILPAHASSEFLDRAVISADGNHIVGSTYVTPMSIALRWTRDGTGWLPPEEIGPGEPKAITPDGNIVVGTRPDVPWIWTANPNGGGSREPLGTDPSAWAQDVTHTGSMVVGFTGNEVPVYWVVENDQWVEHVLPTPDGQEGFEAHAIAEVDGKLVIAGHGNYLFQDEWILSAVAWIPDDNGSYGQPVRLLGLGGPDSWAHADDINRNGFVTGWSETEPFSYVIGVLWNLFNQSEFQINAGLNDAWYNAETNGQGYFISVFPDIGQIFLAWFTYDTERPPESASANLADPGHRWLTAFGAYEGNQATLDVEVTKGGVFDSSTPPTAQSLDGTINLQFSSCTDATIAFNIPSIGQQGVIPIRRVAPDNIAACESLGLLSAGSKAAAADRGSKLTQTSPPVLAADNFSINAGLNDAWYNPATGGQGFFLDVFPDSQQAFLAWFTYDTERPDDSAWYNLGEPGHRWLTAFGDFSGNQATLDIEVTKGGVFNSDDFAPTQNPDGTITLQFSDCNTGTVTYDIPSIDRQGVIPIERIALDNVPLCESLQVQEEATASSK